MSYKITLVQLKCSDAQEVEDEPYLKVNGHWEWGPVDMRTGDTETMNQEVLFDGDLKVELWERDRGPSDDDHIGTMELSEGEVASLIKDGGRCDPHTFARDSGIVGDARYTLTFTLSSS